MSITRPVGRWRSAPACSALILLLACETADPGTDSLGAATEAADGSQTAAANDAPVAPVPTPGSPSGDTTGAPSPACGGAPGGSQATSSETAEKGGSGPVGSQAGDTPGAPAPGAAPQANPTGAGTGSGRPEEGTASGGTTPTGDDMVASAGSPGMSSAGGSDTGTGGSSGESVRDSGEPNPSMGCGATTIPEPCDTSGSPCTMTIDGTEREFYVVLPDAYDPDHPYPVVFQYHPLGGNAEQGMNMYNIRPNFPDAIYATPDGLQSGDFQGFSNTDGEDEALTRAMMADMEEKYCVDKSRYFSTGFSFGGSMSYTVACNMSDVFRAIGAMSGAPISGATCTTVAPERPVAVWATHGSEDTALPITMAEPIIEALVANNGCDTTTHSVEPDPCVEYDGCDDGYPVVWCRREGDPHAIPGFAAEAIANFFQQF